MQKSVEGAYAAFAVKLGDGLNRYLRYLLGEYCLSGLEASVALRIMNIPFNGRGLTNGKKNIEDL